MGQRSSTTSVAVGAAPGSPLVAVSCQTTAALPSKNSPKRLRCRKCHKIKSTSQFYRRPANTSGYRYYCKECTRKLQVGYDAARKEEKLRARYIRWDRMTWAEKDQYRARRRPIQRRWRRRNPEKWNAYQKKYDETAKGRARYILAQAVLGGVIRKPSRCADCNTVFPRRKIQGHHPDHSKPLDVIWCCPTCHGRRSRKYA